MLSRRRRASEGIISTESDELSITVIGLGGGGCNAINRLSHMEPRCRTIAVNTDKRSLTRTQAEKRLLIGGRSVDGKGTDGRPKVGRDAVTGARVAIEEIVEDSDIVFIVSGLGGGTGTGGAPPLADIARKSGCQVISLVTLPYSLESRRRRIALKGLRDLRKASNLTIVLDNDRLLGSVPTLKARLALSVIDQLICEIIIGIARPLADDGMTLARFSEFQDMGGKNALATVLWGESADPYLAIEGALANPLLDVDTKKIDSVLLNVAGGNFLSDTVLEAMRRDLATGLGLEPALTAFVEPERRNYRAMVLLAGKGLNCSQ